MAKITYKGVKFHPNFYLLFPGFRAISLFGHVFVKMSRKELETFMTTYQGKVMANHEYIHKLQAKSFSLRWLTFYIKYLAWWVYNLFAVGFSKKAYYNIPFEKEAYCNEQNFNYETTQWKKYK